MAHDDHVKEPCVWRDLLDARAAVDAGEPCCAPSAPSPLWALFGALASTPRGASFVIAHLGQSLDGRIATESGHSQYIGCPESLVHLHRLRALTDAVVVGVGTVLADGPQLTTRLVDGPNPVRVVLDPRARLTASASVVADEKAPTVVVHADTSRPLLPRHVTAVPVRCSTDGTLAPADVLRALGALGLTRILIEGGGHTVSRFVAARAVHRLQFAVAPLLIGSGRPALSLPPVETLAGALRPPCRRFDLGADTLFDFALEAGVAETPA